MEEKHSYPSNRASQGKLSLMIQPNSCLETITTAKNTQVRSN